MLTGGCLCGAVRYEVDAQPLSVYYCHCSKCRRASGSSFATNMLVAQSALRIVEGEPLLGVLPYSNGDQRHFCSVCGSPIFNRLTSIGGVVSVRCGTLDSAPELKPQAHIWVSSKAPWFEICDNLPQYEKNPPAHLDGSTTT